MSATVAINGLTMTHCGSGGEHSNSAPDVCRTAGGTPVPYFITAVNPDIDKGTQSVFADGGNMIAIKPSIYRRCSGDEAGLGLGVVSGTHLRRSHWITYSPNVYAEGENICRLSDKLFMNDRNTISGAGGQQEADLSTGDAVLDHLCEIFCEARDEWHKCRAKPPAKGCTSPSNIAKQKTRTALNKAGSPLNRAVRSRFRGGAFGAAERSLYNSADKLLGSGRKIYTEKGLKDALRRAVTKAAKEAGINRLKKMGRRFWMKAVPGLNVITTVIDGALTAKDIYDIISAADGLIKNAVRIQPDFAVLNGDGSVAQIYDYKFDAPGYQDSASRSQQQLYRGSKGNAMIEVNNARCNCSARLA